MIELFPSRIVAIEIFGWSIHWYGIMYLIAFVVALFLSKRLQHYRNLQISDHTWSDILMAIVLGVIIGGRLGYVFFYNPLYYIQSPLEILKIWEGGMASHGGFIGVIIAMLYVTKRHSISLLRFADTIVIPAAIGIAIGRIGNYINQELYGTATDFFWGLLIPGDPGLHHPTFFYSIVGNLVVAIVCYVHIKKKPIVPGRTAALFLMGYAVQRCTVEVFRIQPYGFYDVYGIAVSRGQLLSAFLFLGGVVLWCFLRGQLRDEF